MDFLALANSTDVSPDLLGAVLKLHAELPPEDRKDHTVIMIRIFQLLDERGMDDERRALSLAIDFRLTALARLLHDRQVLGWTIPGDGDSELIHPSLVEAAAKTPLIKDAEHRVTFDPVMFRDLALSTTEAEGSA